MFADITFLGIVWYVVAGFVIGLARPRDPPGKQHLDIVATLVLGVASAIVGGVLWALIFSGNDGIAWIGSIIVAVIALFSYERMVVGRRHAT